MNILIFTHYYLPGYKAGGALRTIANMIEAIGNNYNFYIITCNHDFGDNTSYKNVVYNKWITLGKAKVKYLQNEKLNYITINSLLNENNWDLVYLQSFWDFYFSILPIIVKKIKKYSIPFLLAPRGEFGEGALKIKKIKKQMYLIFCKIFNIYKNIYFHCSSDDEQNDLQKIFTKINHIFVALDFPEQEINRQEINQKLISDKKINICFVSRIVPKKNLYYALQILKKIKINVNFDIIGPLEDAIYWKKCEDIISVMPNNININYLGSISHDQIAITLSKYELFLFPTLNENFGHVIYEALNAGVVIITSDQTPWHELELRNAGWEIPLKDQEKYVKKIEYYYSLSTETKKQMSNSAKEYGLTVKTNKKIYDDNIKMFNYFVDK